jgi:hypothetical protein
MNKETVTSVEEEKKKTRLILEGNREKEEIESRRS